MKNNSFGMEKWRKKSKKKHLQKILLQRHVVDLQRHVVKVNKRTRTRPIILSRVCYDLSTSRGMNNLGVGKTTTVF